MADCCSVIDVHGLHALATLSANLKAGLLEKLQSGELGVLAVVWKEFEEVYEDEAEAIAEYVSKKISLGRKSRVGAASIADQLNSGFPQGVYDRNGDLYTAATAIAEGYTVVTIPGQIDRYESFGCTAMDVETLAML